MRGTEIMIAIAGFPVYTMHIKDYKLIFVEFHEWESFAMFKILVLTHLLQIHTERALRTMGCLHFSE